MSATYWHYAGIVGLVFTLIILLITVLQFLSSDCESERPGPMEFLRRVGDIGFMLAIIDLSGRLIELGFA